MVGRAALAAAAMLAAGCAEELGPVPMPVARVRGEVKEGDRPVGGGWIEFLPVEGTIGNLRSARLRADGTFDADGVAVGTNGIRLVNTAMSPGYRYPFSTFSSPIRRVVAADPSGPLTIDLVAEAIKYREKRSRIMAGTAEGP